jgi:hypothetical protein
VNLGVGPHPHWHVPGYCHQAGHPQPRHEPQPARYWVLAPNGYWFAMCEQCCATERRIGAENPDLAPAAITTYYYDHGADRSEQARQADHRP